MTKQTKTWNKPTLARLGQITDVAGTQVGACQNQQGSSPCGTKDGLGFS